MSDLPSIKSWWRSAELDDPAAAPRQPAWLDALSRAHAAELSMDAPAAAAHLARYDPARTAEPASDDWDRVRQLLGLRIRSRSAGIASLPDLGGQVTSFIETIPSQEQPTLARAHHLL